MCDGVSCSSLADYHSCGCSSAMMAVQHLLCLLFMLITILGTKPAPAAGTSVSTVEMIISSSSRNIVRSKRCVDMDEKFRCELQ